MDTLDESDTEKVKTAKNKELKPKKSKFKFMLFILFLLVGGFCYYVYNNPSFIKDFTLDKKVESDQANSVLIKNLEQKYEKNFSDFENKYTDQINKLKNVVEQQAKEVISLQNRVLQKENTKEESMTDEDILRLAFIFINDAQYTINYENNLQKALSLLDSGWLRIQNIKNVDTTNIFNLLKQDFATVKAKISLTNKDIQEQLQELIGLVDQQKLSEKTDAAITQKITNSVDDWKNNTMQNINSFKQNFFTSSSKADYSKSDAINLELILRENIKLQLIAAKFAINNKQNEELKTALANVMSVFNKYFDQTSSNSTEIHNKVTSINKMIADNENNPIILKSYEAVKELLQKMVNENQNRVN